MNIRRFEVQQRHVGPVPPKLLNGFTSACCLRHHDHIRLVIDDLRNAFAQQVMIIDAENANAGLLPPRQSRGISQRIRKLARYGPYAPRRMSAWVGAAGAGGPPPERF